MTTATKAAPKKSLAKTPAQKLLEFARETAKTAKTWPELSNAIYGVGALFGRLFPTIESRTAFSKSAEYRAISDLIDKLPGPGDERSPAVSCSGKLLVRLPASLHAALLKEAGDEGVSVNQLVVSKLSAQLREIVRA